MKSSLWMIIALVTGIVGFLMGYGVSSFTGTRPLAAATGHAAPAAAPPAAQAPAQPASAGYGAAEKPHPAAAGYGGAEKPHPAAAGYGGAEKPREASAETKPKAAGY